MQIVASTHAAIIATGTALLIAAGVRCSQVSPRIDGLFDSLRVFQGGFVGLVRGFFLGLLARVLGFLALRFREWLPV